MVISCLVEIDLDECALGLDACLSETECVNNEGSYQCTCKEGYFSNITASCEGRFQGISKMVYKSNSKSLYISK